MAKKYILAISRELGKFPTMECLLTLGPPPQCHTHCFGTQVNKSIYLLGYWLEIYDIIQECGTSAFMISCCEQKLHASSIRPNEVHGLWEANSSWDFEPVVKINGLSFQQKFPKRSSHVECFSHKSARLSRFVLVLVVVMTISREMSLFVLY